MCLCAQHRQFLLRPSFCSSVLRRVSAPTNPEWDSPRWIRLSARETPSPLVLPYPTPPLPPHCLQTQRQTGCTSGKQTTGTPLIKGLSDPHSPPLPTEEGSSGHAPAKSHVSIPSRPPRPRERGRPRPVAHQLLAVPPGTTPPSTCPLQRVLSAPPPVRRRRAASPPEDPGERLRSELQRVSPAA